MELLRFILAALFITLGLFVLGIATLGLYRLKYVLNRIHASSKCDTLGGMLVLIGICILTGFSFTTLKILALSVFIWLTNPLAIFMIGRAEVLTNPNLEDEVSVLVVPSKKKQANEEVNNSDLTNNTEAALQ
jgi:multicomponent Na+:H+ antiporter subunit G